MADLSEIDLDAGGGSETPELHGHEDEVLGGGEVHSTETEDTGHSKTEDLYLYYRQSWKARMGMTGIVVCAFLGISAIMTTALLIFSYTSAGRSFLQGLKFFIF